MPIGPQWAYEIKHDGFRFICSREGDRVRVFSRRGHDWTDRVPRIAEALAALARKHHSISRRAAKRYNHGAAMTWLTNTSGRSD